MQEVDEKEVLRAVLVLAGMSALVEADALKPEMCAGMIEEMSYRAAVVDPAVLLNTIFKCREHKLATDLIGTALNGDQNDMARAMKAAVDAKLFKSK